MVSISYPNSPDINASDNLAVQHQKVVERKVAMGYEKIGRERQEAIHMPSIY